MTPNLAGSLTSDKQERQAQGALAARNDLAGLAFRDFSAWCRGVVGHCERFHRASYRQLMGSGEWRPEQVDEWREAERTRPGVIAALQDAAAVCQRPEVTEVREMRDATLGVTLKVLARLGDGAEVETVLIPMAGGGHHTVCVSSQVGCKMGCTFCHTAKMGLIRQLSAAEIVGQVLAATAHTSIRPRNVVFMGMGEPLDNLDEVARAVWVLTDVHGLGLASRHITISTVGRVDGIARMPSLGLHRINLAVSLSAPDDELRSRLMPVNRVYDLARLKAALLAFPLPRGRRILISYVLMAGVNDGSAQAEALASWLLGLPALVNLIPCNPIPGSAWQASEAHAIARFRERIEAAGIPVRLRRTKGDAVMAACGQLGDPARRRIGSRQIQ